MKEIENLAQELMILSGIGVKTANRYAYEILQMDNSTRKNLIQAIDELKLIKTCTICNNYTKDKVCSICMDNSRQKDKLVIVVHQKDILKIENIIPNTYFYYVLGAIIDPLNGMDVDVIKTEEIINIIKSNNTKEIILVLPTNQEGEITSEYLKNILFKFDLTFTKIAQGVPIGGDLEYLDEITLLRSIQKRQEF